MRKTVNTQNLICDACAKTITNRLTELRNIRDVNVDLEKGMVRFDFFTKHDFEHTKIRSGNDGLSHTWIR